MTPEQERLLREVLLELSLIRGALQSQGGRFEERLDSHERRLDRIEHIREGEAE